MDYKDTQLWSKAFDTIQPQDSEYALRLQEEFDNARKNATEILQIISNDFPQLTIHDITHIDALWQTGSVIAGDNIQMNPIEGFVLGCSFLMHDAVLSYEATGGKERLRETVEWKDYFADYNNSTLSEDEKLNETDFRAMRHLHAKYAKDLYKQRFSRKDGSAFYIIENESIRKHLGEIIGIIASSHHWDIEEVDKMDTQIPPLAGYPADWNLNPMKLACILRCADAGHIDAGRAPDHLLQLLKRNGVSRDHWIAQNHLSQISVDRNDTEKVVIRSTNSFTEDEYSAWNVAFDAIRILDQEIKASNTCLKKHGIQVFQAKGVSGAESQEELSKYIKTIDWMPCDANIHISNVERLVKMLGGERLYGKEHHLEIVIRELLQNARDAVAARRVLDDRYSGHIDIEIDKSDGTTIITISDDGIGMSLKTIKDCFLNFGDSFWSSDLAKAEYPGLNSSSFKSVGRFGIGFYAVFMIASKVTIETRRFDRSLDETLTVKFPNGLCLRPIISWTKSKTPLLSTRIELTLDNTKCRWDNICKIKPGISGASSFEVPYVTVLENLTAGLDVDVFYSENKKAATCIHSNIINMELGTPEIAEWIKNITYARYIGSKQCDYIDENSWRMRQIIIGEKFCGIAAINTMWEAGVSFFDVTTIGGLSNSSSGSSNAEFLGCIITNPVTARRESDLSSLDLTEWAKEQYQLLIDKGLNEQDRLYLPYILYKYDIDMIQTMIIRIISKRFEIISQTIPALLDLMRQRGLRLVFALSNWIDSPRIENYLNYQSSAPLLHENERLFIVEKNSGFLELDEENEKAQYNLMNCLRKAAKRASLELNIVREKNRLISHFSGFCDAYVVSIATNQNEATRG